MYICRTLDITAFTVVYQLSAGHGSAISIYIELLRFHSNIFPFTRCELASCFVHINVEITKL
jgi:hypothetical protein